MRAFLKFGSGNGPFQTISAEVKEKLLPWQLQGLQYTRTGYGSKIPSGYMLKYVSRWLRIYTICYSNVATHYVLINGEKISVDFDF